MLLRFRGICHEKFWKNYRKAIFVIWDYATSKFEGPQKSEKLETSISLDFSLRANKGDISLKCSTFWNYYLKKKERKKIYIVILKQNITCDFEIGILLYRLSLTCSKISEKKCTWQNCILCAIAKYTRVNIKLTENYLSYHKVKKTI